MQLGKDAVHSNVQSMGSPDFLVLSRRPTFTRNRTVIEILTVVWQSSWRVARSDDEVQSQQLVTPRAWLLANCSACFIHGLLLVVRLAVMLCDEMCRMTRCHMSQRTCQNVLYITTQVPCKRVLWRAPVALRAADNCAKHRTSPT